MKPSLLQKTPAQRLSLNMAIRKEVLARKLPEDSESQHSPAKNARTTPRYEWTTGEMRNVTHVALIGRGGYSEVHKVSKPSGMSLISTDAE